jgi:hypothetical protein
MQEAQGLAMMNGKSCGACTQQAQQAKQAKQALQVPHPPKSTPFTMPLRLAVM